MMFLVLLCLTAVLPSEQQIMVNCNNGNDTQCRNASSEPCRTLDTALEVARMHNDTIIHVEGGPCLYNTSANITGDGSRVTTVECNNGTGFGFINDSNVSNVIIKGLTLTGCGQLSNSTTINSSSDSVMLFRAALYFVNVTNVTIDDVVVSNSIGMGVAMYDVTGHVSVTNSIFRNNRVPSHELQLYPGGGGFSVEFTFCKPGMINGTDCDSEAVNSDATYLFDNCTFEDNNATTVNDVKYASIAFGVGYPQFGRGGGLSVFFRGEAIGNIITVNNTQFTNNGAIWGAGFHSDILDYSANNRLTISNSIFSNNSCYYDNRIYGIATGGGGIRIALHYYNNNNYVTSNHIEIVRCNFSNNAAGYGGGVSFSTVRESGTCDFNYTISFKQCYWTGNVARTGSGVDLNVHTFPTGLVTPVWFEDCSFIDNSNDYVKNRLITPLGIGSLYSDAIPVEFYGSCVFTGNTGGALAATAAILTFRQNSSLLFENNTGHHGGGIALLGNAYMFVEKNTSLSFYGNTAEAKGGAIFSLAPSERDFVSTKKCFVLYEDYTMSPYNWSTSFVFRNNTATSGNAIFVTTLLPCIWDTHLSQTNVNNPHITQVLYWNGTFDYGNSSNLSLQIATEPLNVNTTKTDISIPPGKLFDLSITPIDDRLDYTAAVFLVKADSDNNSVSVDPTSSYTSNGAVKLRGRIETKFDLKLQTVGMRPLLVTFHAQLTDCPPGYDIGDDGVCECSSYYGISKCDDEKFVAYIRPQIWAGYEDGSHKLLTGDCPTDYCYGADFSLLPLPSDSSNKSLDALLCKPKNRTGRLCGRCIKDHYVYMNSPTYECGRCDSRLSKHGIPCLMLLKYIPMTVFLCIIMFFNISLVDGPLNAFILFSQILAAADLYAGGSIKHPHDRKDLADGLVTCYQFLYDIWNLNYFETLTEPFCTFQYRSALPILLLEYVSASYPVVLFVLFFSILPWLFSKVATMPIRCIQNCTLSLERCCIRFRAGWSIKNSIIHGLVTFLILSYVKFTAVSWRILAFGIVYGKGGQDSNTTVKVAWFDGKEPYFGDIHGKYAAVALVVLICFVFLAPLFLLSYPYLPKLLTKLKLDDKWIVQKLILRPLGHCIPFFDIIQGCFKDEYRFFAAFYFVYRIIAWAIFSFSPTVREHYVWQIGFYTAILFLHSSCQPYKKRWHNMVDTFIFSLLIIINAISFYRYSGFLPDLSTSPKSFWVQLVLIYFPLIYLAAYVLRHCVKCCRPQVHKLMRQLSGRRNYQVFEPRNESSAEFPARLYDGSSHEDEGKDCELKNSTKWTRETPAPHNAAAAATGDATSECPSTIQDYGSTKSTS